MTVNPDLLLEHVEDPVWIMGQSATLHEIAAAASRIATANGFDEVTWENLPTKLLFAVTELHEARLAAYGDGDFGEELADVTIRLLAMLHDVWGPTGWTTRVPSLRLREGETSWESAERILWPVIEWITKAAERWRDEDPRDAAICIEFAVREVHRAALRTGVDLHGAMLVKLRKNTTRQPLHGHRRSES